MRADQVSGNDEEDINPNEAAREPGTLRGTAHRENRNRAQAVNVGR